MTFPEFGDVIQETKPGEENFPQFGDIVVPRINKPIKKFSLAKAFKTPEYVQEAAISPITGATGAYGNVQSLLSRLMGAPETQQLPGQQLQSQLESQVPESQLPWLQDENIMPQFSALPTSGQVRQGLGIEEPKTLSGRLTKGTLEPVGGAAAFGGLSPLALLSAASSGFAGESTKELGGGPLAQLLASLAGGFAPSAARGASNLAKKPIIEESGIQLPKAAATPEKQAKFFKPQVAKGEKKAVMENLTKQSKNLIDKIKKEELPISEEIEKGIDVTARNNQRLTQVENIAKELPEQIQSKEISDYLTNLKNKILTEAPIPAEDEKEVLKLADEWLKKFEVTEGGKRYYSPKEYLKQYRNINKDEKKLFETKFVHGERLDLMKFYEGLKDSISKTFERGTPKEFSNLFKETNKDYSATKKLEKFENIMEKISDTSGELSTTKLANFLKNPKKAEVLKGQIGEEGLKKIKAISSDVQKAEKSLSKINEYGLKDVVKSSITAGLFKYIGLPIALPIKVTSNLIKFARGYALTAQNGERNISNFLKAVRSGNKNAVKNTLQRLDSDIQNYEKERKKK